MATIRQIERKNGQTEQKKTAGFVLNQPVGYKYIQIKNKAIRRHHE
jgi:hypothetical protein